MTRSDSYRLASWTYKPGLARLLGPGESRQLTPQLNRLLLALIQAEEQTLSKDALLERVWNGRIVSDDAIARAISELRKILRADDGDDPIRTLHGFGYRLDVEVAKESHPISLNIILIFLLLFVAVGVGVYLFNRPRPALPTVAATPLTVFNNLDRNFRYLPVAQRLLYLEPGQSGQTLFVEELGARRLLLSNRQLGPLEASPEGRAVGYVDLTDGCELRRLNVDDGSSETVGHCLGKASHAVAWAADDVLLFGQLSGGLISLYDFSDEPPNVETVDASGCVKLNNIARRVDGRTFVSCTTERGDALLEWSDEGLLELLRYRSISKFVVDGAMVFYLIHAPRWKSGVTRFSPPDDFTFLQTGWVVDLAWSDSRLVMVRDLSNPDLVGFDLDNDSPISIEESPVRTQAFTVDEAGALWQLDDRSGRLALYRDGAVVPLLDESMLDFDFTEVECMSVDNNSGTIEFSVSPSAGPRMSARHDIESGAILSSSNTSQCPAERPVPPPVLQKAGGAHSDILQAQFDAARNRWYFIIERSAYMDIAYLEPASSH